MLLAVAVLLAAAGSSAPSGATTGETSRASVSSTEREANGSSPAITVPDTTSPAFDLAGLHVAFSSDASNLIAGDTNGVADVFWRDLESGKTRRVSVTNSGKQANGPSYSPALSVEGHQIAFVSEASNLVPGDTNGVADIFVRDLKKDRTTRVSVTSSGKQANGPSRAPTMSLFGRWVGFDSDATNLGSGDDNAMPDAFVHDRARDTTTRIEAPPIKQYDPKPNEAVWTSTPTVSFDGKWIAFERIAARLLPANTPLPPDVEQVDPRLRRPALVSSRDVFFMHRESGKTRKASIPAWNTTSSAYRTFASEPTISADGNYVVLTAWSVMDDTRARHEVTTGDGIKIQHPLTDVDRDGQVTAGEDITVKHPVNRLDDDGFVRNPLDHKDVWVYDRRSKVNFPVSRNSVGLMGNADSYAPRITSQGHAVAFASDASNLAPGDENAATDVFVWDSRDRATSIVSVGPEYAASAGPATRPSMSYDGRKIAFASMAGDLGAADSNLVSDIYLHDRRIDLPDAAPMLPGQKKIRTIDPNEPFRLRFKGRDADGDPLRYGLLASAPPPGLVGVPVALPHGVQVDTRTGVFEWTPRADQAGPWIFVVWASDPRGKVQPPPLVGPKNKKSFCLTCDATFVFLRVVVRTAAQSAQCQVSPC